MVDCSDTAQYSDDFDENAWLNEIYDKIGAISSTQLKKSDSKTIDVENKKIKSKKNDMKSKKSKVKNVLRQVLLGMRDL